MKMKMKPAIYFIEIMREDGNHFFNTTKLYKCDTFWSKSEKPESAKVHDDSQYDQDRFLTSLASGFKYSFQDFKTNKVNDKDFEYVKSKYIGGVYGYQTIIEATVQGTSSPKDIKLSEPVYLKVIDDILRTGEVTTSDYKVILRDKKIDQILK